MRFFLFWCAVLHSTRAQRVSSDPTSTSKGTSIPWITYTSTRSCTTRPSTIFVYTSNSSTFLLTHYGPSSGITPIEPTTASEFSGTHDAIASDSSLTVASSGFFGGNSATSLPPLPVASRSTCPLPSTVTVSAPLSSNSCGSATEKTVTSYVMTSCPAHSGSSTAPSIVQSGTAAQFTEPRQAIGSKSSANTTSGGRPSDTTLAYSDSTLGRGDTANLCTSVTERTITVEHTIERTITAPKLEPIHITFTTLPDDSTFYLTSLSEHTASASFYSLDPILATYTKLEGGSTVYRTSVLQESSGRDAVVFTTYQEASTVFLTTVFQQTPKSITVISTEVQPGSTFYSISTVGRTAAPLTITYTQLLEASIIPRTSVIRQMPTTITLTSTELQSGSTTIHTSIITSTPEPLTTIYTETREGSIIYSTSVSESTPDPLVITYTEIREVSTQFITTVVESTPEPLTLTSTIVESGSLVYITSYIDRTASFGVETQTLTEDGQTIYLTTTAERTGAGSSDLYPTTRFTEPPVTIFITKTEILMASGESLSGELPPTSSLAAMPTSAFSTPASTTSSYTLEPSQDTADSVNASVLTIISTIYATLNASDCVANSSVSTITSFVYDSDSSITSDSDGLATLQSSYASEIDLATRTVTSFIYGPSITAGSTGELMVMTITERDTANCSFDSTDGWSMRTVTSLIYPSSCDFQYTTRYVPEITVTRRGSTVTVYASSMRTITAYSITLGNGTLSGDASRTDDSEPTPNPEGDEDGDPEEEDEGGSEEGQPDQGSTPSKPLPTASAEPVPSPTPVVANPTELAAQQGAASDPYVIAQVVNPEDNPPISPASNSSFLLVTFGSMAVTSSSSTLLRKRRASQQPLTYNATILFSSVTGGIYNLSATATMAQIGDTPPSCALSICVENMCGPSYPLGTTFDTYTYTYNSPSTVNNQAGVFSIRCLGQAYVGLDNVRVDPVFVPQPSPSPPTPGVNGSSSAGLSASATTSAGATIRASNSSPARASVRTVTTSILSILTTTAYATQTLTRIESAQAITITQISTDPGKSNFSQQSLAVIGLRWVLFCRW